MRWSWTVVSLPDDPGPSVPGGKFDTPKTCEGAGCPWIPCDDNSECMSGFRVDTPDGRRCSAVCADGTSRPEGFECRHVATRPDVVFACVHPAPRVCRPCAADADMAGMGIGCSDHDPDAASCLAGGRIDASTHTFGYQWAPSMTEVMCCAN